MRVSLSRPGFCVFLIVLALACTPAPQDPSDDRAEPAASRVLAGLEVSLESRTLQERRELLVYLPDSYGSSTFRYPVLYLLDAGSEFLHHVGIVEFLAAIDRIPELIVVGIVNTNRSRDLTPESANEEETAFWDEVGGAEPFRVFLRDELIPFIDREYRTEPYRILRGQSFGGLLAIHDYMSDAPIFDAVLASSPAIGWNFETLIKAAPAFFADGVPRPIYVASAEKDFPGNLADILEFVRIVDAAAPDPTLWHHESFEGDGHYSLVHQSSYRGLEFLYAKWPVPDAIATQANFSLYERHFQELTDRFGYEIRIPLHSIVRLGNGLLRQQRFEEGIAVFERGIQLYPEQPEAHWHMGEALRLAGRIDEARPHFESAYQVAVETSAPDVDDYRETLESLTEAPVQKE